MRSSGEPGRLARPQEPSDSVSNSRKCRLLPEDDVAQDQECPRVAEGLVVTCNWSGRSQRWIPLNGFVPALDQRT
jgi:hypothetical protein